MAYNMLRYISIPVPISSLQKQSQILRFARPRENYCVVLTNENFCFFFFPWLRSLGDTILLTIWAFLLVKLPELVKKKVKPKTKAQTV